MTWMSELKAMQIIDLADNALVASLKAFVAARHAVGAHGMLAQ